MNVILDTETTGLPDWGAPSDAAHQPHLVQLAMIMLDEHFRERAAVSVMIKPDGWEIPESVAAIHGITTELATRHGIPEKVAVDLYVAFMGGAGQAVGHNVAFDLRIMRIALLRAGYDKAWQDANKPAATFCTMHSSRSLVGLPKAPKLSECIEFFFAEKLEGAHDAMVDARGAERLFRHLHGLRQPEPEETV